MHKQFNIMYVRMYGHKYKKCYSVRMYVCPQLTWYRSIIICTYVLVLVRTCRQIEYIQNNDASPGPGEEKLPALTAENRTTWSNFYQKHLKTGENAQTMDILTKVRMYVPTYVCSYPIPLVLQTCSHICTI